MLPLEARGSEYADLIARVYHDNQLYANLITASRTEFEQRLNWDAWGISVNKLIREMLDRRKSSSKIDVITDEMRTNCRLWSRSRASRLP
jgi:hypothetical protein